MGFVAVSVDESETDGGSDGNDFTGNIVRRAELAIETTKFLQTLDGGDVEGSPGSRGRLAGPTADREAGDASLQLTFASGGVAINLEGAIAQFLRRFWRHGGNCYEVYTEQAISRRAAISLRQEGPPGRR
jgi:hypothetical protein